MTDIEIPLGKRTKAYRFLEMIPALFSYGAIFLLVVLSIFNPFIAAVYLLAIIITTVIKAVGIGYHTTTGRDNMDKAQRVDWHDRLAQLDNPALALQTGSTSESKGFQYDDHIANLEDIAANPGLYPKPSQVYNAVIIASYNE